MKFDNILTAVGEFGWYQKRTYLLLGFPAVSIGSIFLLNVVILYTPQHRCRIPDLDNDTYSVQNIEHERLVNRSIPGATDPTLDYDRCHVYNTENGTWGEDNRPINASLVKCHEWVYDKSVFVETFTSKSNFVCDDSMKTSHIQMLVFLGVFVGAIVFGMTGDKLGRKKAMYIGFICLIVSSICVSWAPEFYSFAFLLFMAGGSAHGTLLCIIVISLEIVGPSNRVWTGMLLQIFFAIGMCYLGLLAFLIRQWSWICLAASLPCVVYASYWWCVPESPRWLLSKGKVKRLNGFIRKAAEVNKMLVPENVEQEIEAETNGLGGQLWHLIKSPVLLTRTLILCFNWMVICMTYYGITMNTGNMAGNFYLNFLLMGVAEIPGLLIGLVSVDRFGRRWSNAGSMIVGGLVCLATVPTVFLSNTDLQPLVTALVFIGKLASAMAFGIVYLYTAELLPTVVRNAAMGSCSCSARIGGMLAPYIAKSGELIGGKIGQVEPLVVFGALSIIAGLLLLLLPETLGQQLPDSIEEGEQFGRKTNPTECKEAAADLTECKEAAANLTECKEATTLVAAESTVI